MKRSKLKIGYRVEIRIRPGLLRRSRRWVVWEAFESCPRSWLGGCKSEAKALALYEKLVADASGVSTRKPKWGRR